MSKTNNTRNIVLSILIVLAGAFAIYYALNLESPSYCEDGSCEISKEVKPARFSEYSWEDLIHIANHIKNAPTPDRAQEVAKQYNLITSEGNLTNETKQFITTDGIKVDTRIIGIAADEGSGLTLMCASAPYYHKVNNEDTTAGSWEDSDVRTWLNFDVLNTLPDPIKGAIKPVEKITNNADGGGVRHGTLTDTKDSLWLLSCSEICGDINWFDSRYHVENSENIDKTLSSQGSQYRYFRENGVTAEADPKGALKMTYDNQPVTWWLRSPYIFKFDGMESNFWFDVTSDGYPFNYLAPNTKSGIVFGFCL